MMLRSWVMGDSELRVWDGTLRKAVSMASAIGTNSTEVVRRVFNRLEDEKAKFVVGFFVVSFVVLITVV